ncbi:FAD-binding oxidoreductase [Microbacterium sp. ASV49]|uniref:FAD-linked oxidase C-terminal domain-containing protein n=1 Tax=Microbacterium candidum TaxID=3041922 RepID=A0ABT7MTX0_9MICO|nr:FAD-linked oxidase C-terminal domain-containing protein [Microbacterium sp. ASV49]MDL9977894.1 FAD-linked oxidase C-terminal domain-containing protein [Microbacterium sp. ASV49]
MSNDALADLAAQLPDDTLLTGGDAVEPYRRDRALDPAAGVPLTVARPRTTHEVQTIVRWASDHGIPLVPRGAGTGLSGGATAVDGGIVLSTERMREIRIDRGTRTVTVQPGLLNAELKAAVAAEGLWYPPDPASFEICSIGGNIATNAGGLCCVKYGVTADYVLGLEVVLADGRALRLGGPLIKDVAGLNLLKLFIGSEGTLGVVTEITLRLLPAPPAPRIVAAWFASIEDAAAAIAEISTTIRPSMLEYMDRTCIDSVEDVLALGMDRDAAALVLGGSDDLDPDGRDIAFMTDAFMRHGAYDVVETSPEEGAALAGARRAAIPAVERRGRLLLSDVGVPLPRLRELLLGISRLEAEHEVTIAMLAHAGDGNTHPLVVFDPADDEAAERAELAYGRIMSLAISLGGTISGEHGVGRMKRPWLRDQVGDDVLEVAGRIKHALDPAGILNPGAIFA